MSNVKGHVVTEETRRKISLANTGMKHTEKTKKKISEIQKGRPVPEGTLKNILKMAQERVGKKRATFSTEWRNNLSKALKGRVAPNKGVPVSKEEAQRLRTLTVGVTPWNKGLTGLGGYKWKKGAKTPEILLARLTVEYKLWRLSVYVRDDFTCQECGQRGGRLNADHIKSFAHYPELRYELSNGRTLCHPCHRNTDTYGGKSRGLVREQIYG